MRPCGMDIRAFVDRTWAEQFGLDLETFARPGVHVVAPAPWLADYRGIFLLRVNDACIISAPPDIAHRVRDRSAGRAPDEVYTRRAAEELVGEDAGLVLGPSIHSYLDASTFRAPPPCDARPLTAADRTSVDAFRDDVPDAEWSEGGFVPYPDVVWGAFEDGRLLAMGNMTDFAGQPADVGIVTHTASRGRGYGTRLAGAMTAAALPTIMVIRYRALETNIRSRRVAAKLGFVDHGSNIAVRLRA